MQLKLRVAALRELTSFGTQHIHLLLKSLLMLSWLAGGLEEREREDILVAGQESYLHIRQCPREYMRWTSTRTSYHWYIWRYAAQAVNGCLVVQCVV